MNKGNKVFVRPDHSLRFAKRWGVITDVNYENNLPYTVEFDGGQGYGFYKDELMSEETFFSWFEVGKLAYSYKTKRAHMITGLNYPSVSLDGNEYILQEILPIHECPGCKKCKAGIFEQECDDCIDGGILNGDS